MRLNAMKILAPNACEAHHVLWRESQPYSPDKIVLGSQELVNGVRDGRQCHYENDLAKHREERAKHWHGMQPFHNPVGGLIRRYFDVLAVFVRVAFVVLHERNRDGRS